MEIRISELPLLGGFGCPKEMGAGESHVEETGYWARWPLELCRWDSVGKNDHGSSTGCPQHSPAVQMCPCRDSKDPAGLMPSAFKSNQL